MTTSTEQPSRSETPKLLKEEKAKVLAALKAADAKKAERLVLIDLAERQTFADYLMICHGTSDRHVKAIHEAIAEALRKLGSRPIGVEGEALAQWILMDYGSLVVHIFYEPLRDFYDLEGLWADCPAFDAPALLKPRTRAKASRKLAAGAERES
ncbi:MAG: ribosome silencing factor [Myxococcales bacterium]|nr:MAG: ribosome silencing factor [Myxococcales bacterium]